MNLQVLGALRPTVGNNVGLTTRFSGRYPINLVHVDRLTAVPPLAREGREAVVVRMWLPLRTVTALP